MHDLQEKRGDGRRACVTYQCVVPEAGHREHEVVDSRTERAELLYDYLADGTG